MPRRSVVKQETIQVVTVPESVPAVKSFGKEEVIACLSAIVRADVCDMIEIRDGTASVRDIGEVPPECRCAVASIKNGTGGKGAEVVFYDKLKALDMLCKCLGLYSQDNDDTEAMAKLDDILTNISV